MLNCVNYEVLLLIVLFLLFVVFLLLVVLFYVLFVRKCVLSTELQLTNMSFQKQVNLH